MDIITMSHGSGGKITHDLIEKIFYRYFKNPYLMQGNDSTVLPKMSGRPAVTTDSFVINPIFFKGGDIGKLAVCGTVNDLAMSGAKPLYITAGFIIEEGFKISNLERIVKSMAVTAEEAGVIVVTGDTKVVERGAADGIYINTTGVGEVRDGLSIGGALARPGDRIIVNGSIGDHGVAILSEREGMDFHTELESDCAPLNRLIHEVLEVSKDVRVLRDPTRGGLATTLNEIAGQSECGMVISQEKLPQKQEVKGLCEALGLDPLYMANEGKVIVIAGEEDSEKILEVMRKNPRGRDSQIIGEVVRDEKSMVYLETGFGGKRIVNIPAGELLPRIC